MRSSSSPGSQADRGLGALGCREQRLRHPDDDLKDRGPNSAVSSPVFWSVLQSHDRTDDDHRGDVSGYRSTLTHSACRYRSWDGRRTRISRFGMRASARSRKNRSSRHWIVLTSTGLICTTAEKATRPSMNSGGSTDASTTALSLPLHRGHISRRHHN